VGRGQGWGYDKQQPHPPPPTPPHTRSASALLAREGSASRSLRGTCASAAGTAAE
jgi:hypothetical protein